MDLLPLLTALTFVNVLGIIGIVLYLAVSIPNQRRHNTPRQELLDLLNDKKNVLTAANVRGEMLNVVKLFPAESYGDTKHERDQKAVDELLASIVGPPETEAAALAQGKVETVTGARDDGKLPILKETRVNIGRPTNLHVNKMLDLYGNPFYLSAAPLPSQFVDHWEMIWQENIGVLVWIGRLPLRMDAYFDMKEEKEVTHGPFQINTKKANDRRLKYVTYTLNVTYKGKGRKIIVLHAYEWIQETVSWALRRECEAILQLKDQHIPQIRAGLPGILFQCKLGRAGSAVMSAVYIGFQKWLRTNSVNLLGIIRYVRRHRWGAFEMTGAADQTFLLQVKITFTCMYAVSKFIDTKKLPLIEDTLKEILGQERLSMMVPPV